MSEVLSANETYTIRTFTHLVSGIAEIPVPTELGHEDSIKIGLSRAESNALWQPLCVESVHVPGNEATPASHVVSMYRPMWRPFFFDVVRPRHGIEKGLMLARAVTLLSLQSEDERNWRITEGAQVLSDRKQNFIGTMKLVARYADLRLRATHTPGG